MVQFVPRFIINILNMVGIVFLTNPKKFQIILRNNKLEYLIKFGKLIEIMMGNIWKN